MKNRINAKCQENPLPQESACSKIFNKPRQTIIAINIQILRPMIPPQQVRLGIVSRIPAFL